MENKDKEVKLSIRMSRKKRDQIKTIAKKEYMTLRGLVTKLIDEAIKNYKDKEEEKT